MQAALLALEDPATVQDACASIASLAERAPTLLIVHLQRIVELLWLPLMDGRLETRDAALHALRACLAVISQRDRLVRTRWYEIIVDKAVSNLNNAVLTNMESVQHGSVALVETLDVCKDALVF